MRIILTLLIFIGSMSTVFAQNKSSNKDYVHGKIITLTNDTLNVVFKMSNRAFRKKDDKVINKIAYKELGTDWKFANVSNTQEIHFEVSHGKVSRYIANAFLRKKRFYKIVEDGALTLFVAKPNSSILGPGPSVASPYSSQRKMTSTTSGEMYTFFITNNKTGELIKTNITSPNQRFITLLKSCSATRDYYYKSNQEKRAELEMAQKQKNFDLGVYVKMKFIECIKAYNENCGGN